MKEPEIHAMQNVRDAKPQWFTSALRRGYLVRGDGWEKNLFSAPMGNRNERQIEREKASNICYFFFFFLAYDLSRRDFAMGT